MAAGVVRSEDWPRACAAIALRSRLHSRFRGRPSPVEGQISRLKMLKRAMYGRAKLDLLRARVLAT
jgi:hypothetical protein